MAKRDLLNEIEKRVRKAASKSKKTVTKAPAKAPSKPATAETPSEDTGIPLLDAIAQQDTCRRQLEARIAALEARLSKLDGVKSTNVNEDEDAA